MTISYLVDYPKWTLISYSYHFQLMPHFSGSFPILRDTLFLTLSRRQVNCETGCFSTITPDKHMRCIYSRMKSKCITIILIETVANNHLISKSNKFQLYAGLMKQVVCIPFIQRRSIPSGHYLPFTLKLQ